MQIDWWTLALQTVNFIVLVWLLRKFLYRPVREVIEKRKKLSEQAFADADRQKNAAEKTRLHFEEGQAGLVQERQDMLKKLHEELEAERHKALEEAKGKANELLEAARTLIAGQRDAALAEVRDQVSAMAVELAADLLRKSGLTAPNAVFLEKLEQHLEDMSADERKRLQKDLAVDGARLTVVTPSPLTPEERGQWMDRLNERLDLGHWDKTDFTTEPEILGGVELHFPHAVIKFTWANQLQNAKELLRKDEAAS